jgi:hypothetical protein
MAPARKDALDASGAITAALPVDAQPAAAVEQAQTPSPKADASATVQEFIDPQAELKEARVKLAMARKPRTLRQTIELFIAVRNTKWGISTVNGIAFDLNVGDAQWDKQKHVRAANWVEVAKNPQGFNLDVRGENNQLWFTRAPVKDDKTGVITEYPALPVRGYSDTELPPPQQAPTHWLDKIRPDLVARRDRLAQSGAVVAMPGMVAAVADIPGAVAAFEQDLGMAERNLAAMAMKR